MSEILTSSLAATVTGQIGQLSLAAVALLALAAALRMMQRDDGRGLPAASDAWPERPVLIVAVLLLSVLALILAAGLRQIWGHPVLQPRALWLLVAVLLVAVLVWWRSGDGGTRS